jgi:hypothetical protein
MSANIPKAAREYLGQIGSIKTEAKARASRANALKAHAARRKDPLDLVCICEGGESVEAKDHKTTCPRGRLLWQRERAAAKKEQSTQ